MKNVFWKTILLTVLLSLISLPCLAAEAENLIRNGDFETLEGEKASYWSEGMWYTNDESTLSIQGGGVSGNCAQITNRSQNDARFEQVVPVEPDSDYVIRAMLLVEDVEGGEALANLSVKNTFTYSEAIADTAGEWVPVELYGHTGEDQTDMTVMLRVGGYSNEATGTARFDNVEVLRVDEVPEGARFGSFEGIESSGSSGGSADDEVPARNTEMFVLLACLYGLAVFAVVRKRSRIPEPGAEKTRQLWVLLIGGALLVRLIVAATIRGYNTDINCFTAWSNEMFASGVFNFYKNVSWCDYPPLYMLLLWPVGALRALLGSSLGGSLQLIVLKAWPILFDLFALILLYRLTKTRLSRRDALLIGLFYAFNPAVFVDSAAWGQIDAVWTLMLCLSAWEASEFRPVRSLLLYAAALLTKPQALLFAPIGLLFLILRAVRASHTGGRKPYIRLFTALLGCLGALYAVALACSFTLEVEGTNALTKPVVWLISQYTATVGGYDYITVNAFSLYQIFGLNWAAAETHRTIYLLAWGLLGVSYLYTGFLCFVDKSKQNLPLIGAVLMLLLSALAPMMHERYVFPALMLLLLAFVSTHDRRLLCAATVLTVTLFLNEVLVLQGGMGAANYGHLQSSEAWINTLASAVHVGNALYVAYVGLDLCLSGHIKSFSEDPFESCDAPAFEELRGQLDPRLHLRKKDYALMAAVTAIYAVIAFVNLGTTRAPQTYWESEADNSEVVFDLGSTRDFRIMYYGNICDTHFTLEFSNDGERWTQPAYAMYDQGQIFRWLYFSPCSETGETLYESHEETEDGAVLRCSGEEGTTFPYQTARYVRLKASAVGLKLNEIGFQSREQTTLPVASVKTVGNDSDHSAEKLIDEQDAVPDRPSYYNSTYFDEIYHARTAYELLHGMSSYEWTHPMLGKVLMGIGIRLFGMTPFGWRFMGALTGVLMLPLMYLLAKQLTKSTRLAFVAMALLSVDSMHFTQTRIATIDSYAVFWIMLMYFFMLRFTQSPWTTRREFRRSLIPLGLCGVTMGLAWATKWIGMYASAGLAVLFFTRWFRHLRVWRHAAREGHEKSEEMRTFVPKAAALTLLFCLVFFVVVPLVIYYFSYYWHLKYYGVQNLLDMFSRDKLKIVTDLQVSIFNYHNGLSADTHFFRSPWYQWPIIWWPMWYYSGNSSLPDNMISSISCMGNPAIWWFGLAAILLTLFFVCRDRRADRSEVFTITGFGSQFLPWTLIVRSTFIYHYFASVPFIILASVQLLGRLRKKSEQSFRCAAIILLALALVLFAAFYPLESGLPCARDYARYLRWFKWYNY